MSVRSLKTQFESGGGDASSDGDGDLLLRPPAIALPPAGPAEASGESTPGVRQRKEYFERLAGEGDRSGSGQENDDPHSAPSYRRPRANSSSSTVARANATTAVASPSDLGSTAPPGLPTGGRRTTSSPSLPLLDTQRPALRSGRPVGSGGPYDGDEEGTATLTESLPSIPVGTTPGGSSGRLPPLARAGSDGAVDRAFGVGVGSASGAGVGVGGGKPPKDRKASMPVMAGMYGSNSTTRRGGAGRRRSIPIDVSASDRMRALLDEQQELQTEMKMLARQVMELRESAAAAGERAGAPSDAMARIHLEFARLKSRLGDIAVALDRERTRSLQTRRYSVTTGTSQFAAGHSRHEIKKERRKLSKRIKALAREALRLGRSGDTAAAREIYDQIKVLQNRKSRLEEQEARFPADAPPVSSSRRHSGPTIGGIIQPRPTEEESSSAAAAMAAYGQATAGSSASSAAAAGVSGPASGQDGRRGSVSSTDEDRMVAAELARADAAANSITYLEYKIEELGREAFVFDAQGNTLAAEAVSTLKARLERDLALRHRGISPTQEDNQASRRRLRAARQSLPNVNLLPVIPEMSEGSADHSGLRPDSGEGSGDGGGGGDGAFVIHRTRSEESIASIASGGGGGGGGSGGGADRQTPLPVVVIADEDKAEAAAAMRARIKRLAREALALSKKGDSFAARALYTRIKELQAQSQRLQDSLAIGPGQRGATLGALDASEALLGGSMPNGGPGGGGAPSGNASGNARAPRSGHRRRHSEPPPVSNQATLDGVRKAEAKLKSIIDAALVLHSDGDRDGAARLRDDARALKARIDRMKVDLGLAKHTAAAVDAVVAQVEASAGNPAGVTPADGGDGPGVALRLMELKAELRLVASRAIELHKSGEKVEARRLRDQARAIKANIDALASRDDNGGADGNGAGGGRSVAGIAAARTGAGSSTSRPDGSGAAGGDPAGTTALAAAPTATGSTETTGSSAAVDDGGPRRDSMATGELQQILTDLSMHDLMQALGPILAKVPELAAGAAAVAAGDNGNEEVDPPQGTVCLVFTDVESSTSIWENKPEAMAFALSLHDAMFRRLIQKHRGYEVKTEGDAFMIAFASVVDALLCCMEAQLELISLEWPPAIFGHPSTDIVSLHDGEVLYRGLRVRSGLHVGQPLCKRDPKTGRMDYFGRMVNKAARVGAIGMGGSIIISQSVHKKLRPVLAAGDNEDLARLQPVIENVGLVSLKGIDGLEEVYSVLPHRLRRRTFPQVKGFVMRKGDLTDVLRSSDSDDGSTSRGDNDDAGPSDT